MNSTNLAPSILPSSWHGSLELVYTSKGGGTYITHKKATAPLKLQRPFYPEGEEYCHSVILHTAGGIVGGDRLSQSIHLEPDTHALITTAAAAKIYRSNGQTAYQDINIKIEPGASLEWLPQENIIFNSARYRQNLHIELAPKANLLLWEINRFGRSARGEKFHEGNWRGDTEIWQQGIPLWIDRQQLRGSEETCTSPHALGGFPIVATLAWLGEPATSELIAEARQLWEQYPPKTGQAGVTRLPNGLLCRYRGHSTPEVRQWFIAVWQILRFSVWGRPICLPRVWPL